MLTRPLLPDPAVLRPARLPILQIRLVQTPLLMLRQLPAGLLRQVPPTTSIQVVRRPKRLLLLVPRPASPISLLCRKSRTLIRSSPTQRLLLSRPLQRLSLQQTQRHLLPTRPQPGRRLKTPAAVMHSCLLSRRHPHLHQNRQFRKLDAHCQVRSWQVRAVGCTRFCDRPDWLKSLPPAL